jgi:putative ABC transport system permease protein
MSLFIGRVPLAWSNLMHNKVKFLGSVAGISFAVALMYMEMGFQNAFLDGMISLARGLDADLIMVSKSSYSIGMKGPFSRRHLYEAMQFEEVLSVSPIYVEPGSTSWRDPLTGRRRMIRVIAFRPEDESFLDPGIRAQAVALQAPKTALFDSSGKSWVYGSPKVGTTSELAGRSIRIIGEFALGANFLNDGNMLMSDRNYLRYCADPRATVPELVSVDLGLIKVRDRAKVAQTRRQIGGKLPDSVEVFTKDEFLKKEVNFWRESTPIGYIFQLGQIMGFAVGTIICYQILFAEITSYLREYATLIAMGYERMCLVRVVLLESLYLALIGFAIGSIVALAGYSAVQSNIRMPFSLDAHRVLKVLASTVGMCLISACLALRKLWGASPADLF